MPPIPPAYTPTTKPRQSASPWPSQSPSLGLSRPATRVPMPFVMALLVPVKVIRNNWHAMPAWQCYLIHIAGVLIGGLGLAFSMYGEELFWWQYNTSSYYKDYYTPKQVLQGTLFYLCLTQLCYFIAAFVTVCWAAAPEPWRYSYLRSLKRWWQLTPFHAALTILYLAMGAVLDQFYMDYLPYLVFGLATLGYTLTVMYTTLASLAIHERAGGWPASCRWPMSCEGCGYALYGLGMDQACPECGRPVSQTAECGRGRLAYALPFTWLFKYAVQPTAAGRLLLAHRPAVGQGRALAQGVALLLASGAASTFIAIIVLSLAVGEGIDYIDTEFVLGMMIVTLFAGAAAAGMMTLAALAAASLVGSFFCWFARQNVMHVAAQAMCYTSAALPLWVMFNSIVFGLGLSLVARMFMGSSPAWAALLPLVVLLGNGGFLIAYMVMIARAVKAARWANV